MPGENVQNGRDEPLGRGGGLVTLASEAGSGRQSGDRGVGGGGRGWLGAPDRGVGDGGRGAAAASLRSGNGGFVLLLLRFTGRGCAEWPVAGVWEGGGGEGEGRTLAGEDSAVHRVEVRRGWAG